MFKSFRELFNPRPKRSPTVKQVVADLHYCANIFHIDKVNIAVWMTVGKDRERLLPLLEITDISQRRAALVALMIDKKFITEHKVKWFLTDPEVNQRYQTWLSGVD